jgi:uncharacterized membrane protein YgaE (UPF0421/DUF939 family)
MSSVESGARSGSSRRRERAAYLAGYLTGVHGPVRHLLDLLRTRGLGERVLKSAIAVGLSWELARLIPGNPNPVLAAMTGMFSINLTIAGSLSDAAQRVIGAAWGVAVALLIHALFGLNGLTLAFVVLVAFVGGRRLRLEAGALSQMAATSVLVLLGAAGTQANNVALLHFVNTIVGTVVGLLLNAAIAPPNYLPAARQSLLVFSTRLEGILVDLANAIGAGINRDAAMRCLERARTAEQQIGDVAGTIKRADESLRFHMLGRGQRSTLAVYHRVQRAYEHAAIQARVICRSVTEIAGSAPRGRERPEWIEPDVIGIALANLISAASVSLEHFRTLIDAPRESAEDEALIAELARCRAEINEIARDQMTLLIPDNWTLLGEVVAVSGQLVADLSGAANDLEAIVSISGEP